MTGWWLLAVGCPRAPSVDPAAGPTVGPGEVPAAAVLPRFRPRFFGGGDGRLENAWGQVAKEKLRRFESARYRSEDCPLPPRTSPKLHHRPDRDVVRPGGSLGKLLSGRQHIEQVSAQFYRGFLWGSQPQLAQFALGLVVGEDIVELFDAAEEGGVLLRAGGGEVVGGRISVLNIDPNNFSPRTSRHDRIHRAVVLANGDFRYADDVRPPRVNEIFVVAHSTMYPL